MVSIDNLYRSLCKKKRIYTKCSHHKGSGFSFMILDVPDYKKCFFFHYTQYERINKPMGHRTKLPCSSTTIAQFDTVKG